MDDAPPEECPTCGAAPVEKVLYPVAVHFKGSGFYSTDYGRSRKTGKEGDGDSKPAETKSDTKSQPKSMSRPKMSSPMKPPSSAPASPTASVARHPLAWRPGTAMRATAPATRPNRIHERMPS